MAGVWPIIFLATIPKLGSGHGLVGYIQQDGSTEICTLRSTMGNADGNYGPLTVGASTGDACGNPPGTPKKVLAYNGDGRDLRESQAGSGPYWLNPQETDATCRFQPGDKINAFVYISGNHGGTAAWEHRALQDGEAKISNEDFQRIPNAIWDYSSSGPPETSKALGPHVETFTIPSDLQSGWQTLRWNWVAPGPVQFVHCVDVQIGAANENNTTTSPVSTQQPTTTAAATTSMVSGGFSEVDGGNDRACRGANGNDNAASHYTVIGGTSSLDACKIYCRSTAGCVGIEYNSGSSRCEVWTRPAGIGASVRVPGYQCWRYTAAGSTTMTTSMVSGGFAEVDGGNDRACRGANGNDNAASHYTVIGGVSSLDACKIYCRSTAGCVGIEYNSGSSRCEVWTRPAGIGASVRVTGYQCLRFTAAAGTTTAPSVTCVPLGDCSAWCTQTEYEAFCSAQGTAGSCEAPWCMTSTQTSLVATKSRKHSFLGTALLQAGMEILPAMRREL